MIEVEHHVESPPQAAKPIAPAKTARRENTPIMENDVTTLNCHEDMQDWAENQHRPRSEMLRTDLLVIGMCFFIIVLAVVAGMLWSGRIHF